MRKTLLAGVCLFTCYFGAVAQNKTLGVGVTTPNPNAALHVESPTGNQGFMMPRLTTLQREAMATLLTDADKGLILYDSDLYSIFVWDGASWGSTSQFIVDDPASALNAITVSSSGVGAAGRFSINNVSTFAHAIHAENNGDSTSAAVHGNHTGNGFGVFGRSAGSKFASAAVYGEHVGTGDAAGAFRISNSANTYSALFGETTGSGPAVFGVQKGTGRGGQFQITNSLNANAALRAFTSGTGYSGFFTIANPQSTSAGIFSTTDGKGAAVYGQNTGTGDGFAGLFNVTQASNTFPAIQASTVGSGSGVRVFQDTGTGPGIDIFVRNTASTAAGLFVDHQGLGGAGNFTITNTLNSTAALQTSTNGTGYAIHARHSGTSGDVILAEHAGATSASAGNFRISNAENSAAALFAATNGTNGTAIGASNDVDGIAFAIWRGGVQITVQNVTTSIIATRASAFRITAGGTEFSLGYKPTDGEVFMMYNETGSAINFNDSGIAHNILNGEGKTFVVFPGGVIRGF